MKDDGGVVLTPEEVRGLRRDGELTARHVYDVEDRLNGEAEARSTLAGQHHELVTDVREHLLAIHAELDRQDEVDRTLAHRTVLGLKLSMEALTDLEERLEKLERRGLLRRVWAAFDRSVFRAP